MVPCLVYGHTRYDHQRILVQDEVAVELNAIERRLAEAQEELADVEEGLARMNVLRGDAEGRIDDLRQSEAQQADFHNEQRARAEAAEDRWRDWQRLQKLTTDTANEWRRRAEVAEADWRGIWEEDQERLKVAEAAERENARLKAVLAVYGYYVEGDVLMVTPHPQDRTLTTAWEQEGGGE